IGGGVETRRAEFPSPLRGGVRGGGRYQLWRSRRTPTRRFAPSSPQGGGGSRTHRPVRGRKQPRGMCVRNVSVVLGLDRAAVIGFDAAAFLDPLIARTRKTLLDIDRRRRVGIRSRGIVDAKR